ncbi:MAG: protein O-mannosyl-transferase TMTC1-related protein [Bacteroidia bacterium]
MAKKQSPPNTKSTPPKYKTFTDLRITNTQSYLLVFLFSFLLYSNTLHNGFVMDDLVVITKNQSVQKGFAGIKELFGQPSDTRINGDIGPYRPLTTSFFAIEKQIFGDHSSAWHFMTVLLYSLLCVILFFLLKKLLHNYHPLLPITAALLFAAHPIHTEVVANIKSTDEILCLLFCAFATLYAIRFTETSSWKQVVISWFFFLLALFSKEIAFTFLLIIPLALYFFTRAPQKNILLILIFHFSTALIYLIIRNSILNSSSEITIINNALAGAHSFSERYATAFVILLRYIKLLFYPHPLCWDYSFNQIPIVSFSDPVAILSLLIYLAMGFFALLVFLKPGIFRSSNLPVIKLISFCILFYLISISITSNIFVLINATMGERFLFTPSLAFCILAAFILLKISKYKNPEEKQGNKKILISLLGIILILYSFKTYTRNKDWKDNLALTASGVKACPNSWRTNEFYAWESSLAGDIENNPEKKKALMINAVNYYQKAFAIYDKDDMGWYSYGVVNSNLGNMDEAVIAYQHAIVLNPRQTDACNNLATIYFTKTDFVNSLKYFLMAYRNDSTTKDITFKIGLNYQMMNNPQEAIPYYEIYFHKNPGDKNIITNLAIAYRTLNDTAKTNYYMNILSRMGSTEELQLQFIP